MKKAMKLDAFIFEHCLYNLQICHIDGIHHLARYGLLCLYAVGIQANMYFSFKHESITLFKLVMHKMDVVVLSCCHNHMECTKYETTGYM